MTTDSSKEIKFLWVGFLFVCVLLVAQVLYIRKKFDDNIKILQSSENTMAMRVESIERMLLKMHADEENERAPKRTADKQ
jgi:hypothetical protein